MEIQGRIVKITPVQVVGQNGFQRRDVVIATEEQYPQYIPIDFVQERCALLDTFTEGQLVKISFNLRGREWQNPQGEIKYIVNLQGWRIENAEMPQAGYSQGQYMQQPYGQPIQMQNHYPPQGYMPPQQFQQMPPQQQFQQASQPFQPMPQQFQQSASMQQQAAPEEDDLPF